MVNERQASTMVNTFGTLIYHNKRITSLYLSDLQTNLRLNMYETTICNFGIMLIRNQMSITVVKGVLNNNQCSQRLLQ